MLILLALSLAHGSAASQEFADSCIVSTSAFYILSACLSLAIAAGASAKLWRRSPRTIVVISTAGLATTAYTTYLALNAASGLAGLDLGPHRMATSQLQPGHGALWLAITVLVIVVLLLAAVLILLVPLSWITGHSRSRPNFWRWYWHRAIWAWPVLTGYFFAAVYPTVLVKAGLWQPGAMGLHAIEAAYVTLLAFMVLASIGLARRIRQGARPPYLHGYMVMATLVGACSPLMLPFTSFPRASGNPLAALFACFSWHHH